jgi:hypothetical protein
MNAIDRLDQAAYEMYQALQVICKDPDIRSWLDIKDPMALKQCEVAVQVYLNRNDKEWMAQRYGSEDAQVEAYEL